MAASPERSGSPISVWHAAFSGLCASLVGLGLARFAYTPLIPALISAHWFTHSEAAYLGAANLAGYLAGALLGRMKTRWAHAGFVLRAMMLLTAASMFACALKDFGFAWATLWRFVAGYAGGAIIVLAAPAVLAATPRERRGLVGGAIFAGVGLGVVASGTFVPFLLDAGGPAGAWIGLGALSLLLSLAAWNGWPRQVTVTDGDKSAPKTRMGARVAALFVEYGLNAAGLVPHMIFFVVFIAHGLGRGLEAGAASWILFGIGATIGPPLTGRIADRIGFGPALRLALLVQIAAVALPVFATGPIWLMVSGFLVGGLMLGIVGLVLGRIHELIHDEATQGRAWGYATTAFAIGQAIAAYGYTYLYDVTESYALLFGLGAVAITAALALDVAAGGAGRARRSEA
jgi:MFS family permease